MTRRAVSGYVTEPTTRYPESTGRRLTLAKESRMPASEPMDDTVPIQLTEWDADETTGVFPPVPSFLKLAGRRVLIVGAGPVAASKLAAMLLAGARVAIVAPHISDAMRAAIKGSMSHLVEIHERPVTASDLDGAWYIVAAAPPEVNRFVAQCAESRQVFVNAVDDPSVASAYAAGVVSRGQITIAISTGGRAPALAGLMREALEELFPPDAADWLAVAEEARIAWKQVGVPMSERRVLLLDALLRRYKLHPAGTPDR